MAGTTGSHLSSYDGVKVWPFGKYVTFEAILGVIKVHKHPPLLVKLIVLSA